jgi:hypothetical protein
MFWTNIVDKIKKKFVFSKFFSENRGVYETKWGKKTEREPDKSHTTTWRKSIACWVPGYTQKV